MYTLLSKNKSGITFGNPAFIFELNTSFADKFLYHQTSPLEASFVKEGETRHAGVLLSCRDIVLLL